MCYFLSLVFFLVFLFIPLRVSAQEISGGITVNPAYIDVELEKSSGFEEFEIEYTNNSNDAIELEIFPIDFRQTDERGVIGFLGEESKNYRYALSSFLSFETNSLQLEPGETKTILARVNNRLDLSPGGHYASVIARLVTDDVNNDGDTKIALATSVLVYMIKKGGEQYHLTLKDVDWPSSPVVFEIPSTIFLTFQNEGNVHMTPFGTIKLKDMLGREIYSGSLNNSSFKILPSSRRIIPGYLTNLRRMLPVTFITMEIKGSDFGKNANFLIRDSFIYINLWTLILPVLVLGVILYRRKKLKVKKHKK